MKYMMIMLLLIAGCLTAQEIVVSAEATGEQRALAKCRERMADAIADKLCEWRAELWEPAMPGFPFDRAHLPMKLAQRLAKLVECEVKQEGDRWIAHASIGEDAVRGAAASANIQYVRECRNFLAPSRQSMSYFHNEGALSYDVKTLISAMDKALRVFVAFDVTGLVDSLGVLVHDNISRAIIIPPEDLVVPEGESMNPRLRIYIDDANATPLSNVDVRFTALSLSAATSEITVQTDQNGWASFDSSYPLSQPSPTILGKWRCSVMPDRMPDNPQNRDYIYQYVASLFSKTEFTFEVRSVGRRRTHIHSSQKNIRDILAYFESKGHTYVSDAQEADWDLTFEVTTISKGSDGYGGFVCVKEASVTTSHNGAIVDSYSSGPVEAFSQQNLESAERTAENDASRKLVGILYPERRY